MEDYKTGYLHFKKYNPHQPMKAEYQVKKLPGDGVEAYLDFSSAYKHQTLTVAVNLTRIIKIDMHHILITEGVGTPDEIAAYLFNEQFETLRLEIINQVAMALKGL